MYNATSYTLTFTCGSGANVAILAGETKVIATDGLGSGGVVHDLLTAVNLAGTTKTAALTNAGALSNQGTVTVGVDDTGYDVQFFGATSGKNLLWDESADSLIVTGTTTLVGTTNLDAVDIDGATQIDATVSVGVDDTGYDVKFFGATSGKNLLWDESADSLIVTGTTSLDGAVVINESSADVDTRVESNGNANMIFVDGGNDKVAIGTATATATLTVAGSAVAKTDTDTSNTGSVTLDYTANQNFVLTMTGNVTLANPSTENVGQSGFISFIQDGTGSRVLSVGSQYFCAGGSVIVLSTAANSIDIVPYVVIAAGKVCLGAPQLAFADAS
jgi:hypothetical protein